MFDKGVVNGCLQRNQPIHIAKRCPVDLLLERGANVTTSLAEGELLTGAAERLHVQIIDKLCDEAA